MVKANDFSAAVSSTMVARRNAALRKRDAGDPRNPFRAKPGREQEFFEAAQSVRACDIILKLLENEMRREAHERTRPIRVKITRFIDRVMDFYIAVGLIALATLGFAAAFVLFRLPVPAVQAAAFIGVALALAYAIARK